MSERSTFAAASASNTPFIAVAFALIAACAVSPCVWGLLPLTISYISNAAGERDDKDIVLPTLSFAVGLASVFCSLGLIAATVGGAMYGNSGSTSIVLPLFSNAICCVMGFQLLELIDIPLLAVNTSPVAKPTSDEPILIDGSGQILPSKTAQDEQGSLFRTFLLGGSSALVASPCATPVLTSILAFVASQQHSCSAFSTSCARATTNRQY